MPKHTPGPWEVWAHSETTDRHTERVCVVSQDAQSQVWTVCLADSGNSRADATLIAAAPDLLAAAESALFAFESAPELTHELDSYRATGVQQTLGAQLRTAIARAKGAS